MPGCAAKRVIDLDVVVGRRGEVGRRLEVVGYTHEGDLGIAGREAFAAPPVGPAIISTLSKRKTVRIAATSRSPTTSDRIPKRCEPTDS